MRKKLRKNKPWSIPSLIDSEISFSVRSNGCCVCSNLSLLKILLEKEVNNWKLICDGKILSLQQNGQKKVFLR